MMSSVTNSGTPLPPGAGASLAEILHGVQYRVLRPGAEGACGGNLLTTIHVDSREVRAGGLFVAVPGTAVDGHRYIGDAIKRSCSAVVVEAGHPYAPVPDEWPGCIVEVSDCRQAYATAAENYYGHPAARMKLVGITGTNGKTTITYLLEEALEKLGYRVGVIGTVNYRYTGERGKVILPSPFTTPEAGRLQALLYEMANGGVEYVIMEVSSHALSQVRIGNLQFDVAAFTNLSHDHLDYHQTMEDYFQAKTILFTEHLQTAGTAVISSPLQPASSEDWSERLATTCHQQKIPMLRCGSGENSDVRVVAYESTLQATRVTVADGQTTFTFTSPLVGHFNVDNLLTVLAIAAALGLKTQAVAPLLAESGGAPGRLQRIMVDDTTDFERPVVLVDYAHTPDALRQVLATVAALPHRELYCVFGCGGDRDKSKRPLMGEFAGRFADVVVLTDDNPRTEDPAEILAQIIPGVEQAGLHRQDAAWLTDRRRGEQGYVVVGDRAKAIEETIRGAGKDDIVLLAGKGHEKYQLSLAGKRFFDDCLEAQCALCAWTAEAVAQATAGEIVSGSRETGLLGNVSTDSRTIGKNDIFLALCGDKFDGHDFLAEVVEKGAGCLVVDQEHEISLASSPPQVRVADTQQALGALAHFRRRLIGAMHPLAVVGITGSCGKTTVKEMTASILQRKWPTGPDFPQDCVLKTQGNLNNLIGLPLSLLPLTPRHRAAVLEMGMNVPGEISRMAQVADPDICCITNVHGAHLAGLGTVEGVARAKEELFAASRADATLVVNLDDQRIREMAKRYHQRTVSFSVTRENYHLQPDVYVSAVEVIEAGAITFKLHYGEASEDVHLYTVGEHNVANGACAAAIALAAGASLAEVAAGLADFRPDDRRMVVLQTADGVNVINDTYNANPASMAAGLRTLAQLGQKRSVAILGDMLELGESAGQAHRQIGRLAAQLHVGYLAVVGEFGDQVVGGARDGGMAADRVQAFADKDQAVAWLEALQEEGALISGDWVLVKASRGLQMETIVRRLTGKA